MASLEQYNPQDMSQQKESTSLPEFLEITLTGDEPEWCVDGRPDPHQRKGAQTLGGSLHPILLNAIAHNRDFDETFIDQGLTFLAEAGHTPGTHRGSHKSPEQGTCDCGFCDKMPVILQKAVNEREEITRRLAHVYQQHQDMIGDLGEPFETIIHNAYDVLAAYSPERITVTGERLVAQAEQKGAIIEDVQGDHAEAVAYVNLKQGTTLDTNKLNERGQQAFNMDVWAAVEQARRFGVDDHFALGASLALYVATEMVLVEDKGKPALPVVIR